MKNTTKKIWLISKLKTLDIQDQSVYEKIMNGSTNYLKSMVRKYKYLSNPDLETHFRSFLDSNFFKEITFVNHQKSILFDVIDKSITENYHNNLDTLQTQRWIQKILSMMDKIIQTHRKYSELRKTSKARKKHKNIAKRLFTLRKAVVKKYYRNVREEINKTNKKRSKKITQFLDLVKEILDHLKYFDYLRNYKNSNDFNPRIELMGFRGFYPTVNRMNQIFKDFVNCKSDNTEILREYKILKTHKKELLKSKFAHTSTVKHSILKINKKLRKLAQEINILNSAKLVKSIIKDLQVKDLKINNKTVYNKIGTILRKYKESLYQTRYGIDHSDKKDGKEQLFNKTLPNVISGDTDLRKYEFDTRDYIILNCYKNSRKLRQEQKDKNHPANLSGWINYITKNPNASFINSYKRNFVYKDNDYSNHQNKPKFCLFYTYKRTDKQNKDILKGKYNLYAKLINKFADTKLPLIQKDDKLVYNQQTLSKVTVSEWETAYREYKDYKETSIHPHQYTTVDFVIPYLNGSEKQRTQEIIDNLNSLVDLKGNFKLSYTSIWYPEYQYSGNLHSYFGHPAYKEYTKNKVYNKDTLLEYTVKVKEIRDYLGNIKQIRDTKMQYFENLWNIVNNRVFLETIINSPKRHGNKIQTTYQSGKLMETKDYDVIDYTRYGLDKAYKEYNSNFGKSLKLYLDGKLKEFTLLRDNLLKYQLKDLEQQKNDLQLFLDTTDLHGNTKTVQNAKQDLRELKFKFRKLSSKIWIQTLRILDLEHIRNSILCDRRYTETRPTFAFVDKNNVENVNYYNLVDNTHLSNVDLQNLVSGIVKEYKEFFEENFSESEMEKIATVSIEWATRKSYSFYARYYLHQNKITVSKLLQYVPKWSLKQTIFHELVHIKIFEHTKEFWELCKQFNHYTKCRKIKYNVGELVRQKGWEYFDTLPHFKTRDLSLQYIIPRKSLMALGKYVFEDALKYVKKHTYRHIHSQRELYSLMRYGLNSLQQIIVNAKEFSDKKKTIKSVKFENKFDELLDDVDKRGNFKVDAEIDVNLTELLGLFVEVWHRMDKTGNNVITQVVSNLQLELQKAGLFDYEKSLF